MTRFIVNFGCCRQDSPNSVIAIGHAHLSDALLEARSLRRTYSCVWITRMDGTTLYSHKMVSMLLRHEDQLQAAWARPASLEVILPRSKGMLNRSSCSA